MLVMLDLAILNLILVEVLGNDPISISLSHSSIPITLYGPFKLDNVDGSYSTCLEERVKKCERALSFRSRPAINMPELDLGHFVYKAFKFCKKVGHQDYPMFLEAIKAEELCLKKFVKRHQIGMVWREFQKELRCHIKKIGNAFDNNKIDAKKDFMRGKWIMKM